MYKKAISPVVATALLLVVAVVAVVGFNTWFNTYQTKTLSGVEQSSQNSNSLEIDNLIGSTLYVKNPSTTNLSLNTVKIAGKSCTINQKFAKGSFAVNVSACMNNTVGVVDVVIISNTSVKSKKIYLKSPVVGVVYIPPVTCTSGTPEGFNGGTGASANPWQVCNCTQLWKVRSYPTGNYTLVNNIYCNKYTTWIAIGNSTTPFNGWFNGAGYTINTIKNPNNLVNSYTGLFGNLGTNALVEKFGLVNFTQNNYYNYPGTIAGYNSGNIRKVFTSGKMITGYYCGGIVSDNNLGKINDSYSYVNITGCSQPGGIVGMWQGTVNRVYAIGKSVGGYPIYGWSGATVCSGCFWDIQTTNLSISTAGTGRLTALMKTQSTFLGWDFTNVWTINPNYSYPTLIGVLGQNTVGSYVAPYTPPFNGTGTALDPYQIYTVQDLKNSVNVPTQGYFKVMNDLDFSSQGNWVPLASTSSPYQHNLNGNNKMFKNLRCTQSYAPLGIFTAINTTKTVSNLILKNISITHTSNSGGHGALAGTMGSATNITLLQIYVDSGSGSTAGGLTGSSSGTFRNISGYVNVKTAGYGGSITGSGGSFYDIRINGNLSTINIGFELGGISGIATLCDHSYFNGTINNRGSNTGGIFGSMGSMSGTINKCYSKGKIILKQNSGTTYGVGGIVGYFYGNYIQDSFSNMTLMTNRTKVGGVVGEMYPGKSVIRSYASGVIITNSTKKGGLVGNITGAITVTSSYWDNQTTTLSTSFGGTGKTSALMKQQATYTGWDFTNIWTIINGTTYARLR